MFMGRRLLFIGFLVALGLSFVPAWAATVNVPLSNLGAEGETGSGAASVDLQAGIVTLKLENLQALPHDNPLGSGHIVGYTAWLVNSENALEKLNMGLIVPRDGKAEFTFTIPQQNGGDLSTFAFNQVVITAETEINIAGSQPTGPPILAGHITGTPTPQTPTPAVEVLMGKLGGDVFGFSPVTVTIFSGQTIRWTNVSPEYILPHTATRTEADGPFPGTNQEFDSGSVPFGGTFTRKFDLPPGVPALIFNYHCTPHTTLGMNGRIVVVARPVTFNLTLTGDQEVPPVTTSATGQAVLTFVPSTGVFSYDVTVSGITGTAAHLHGAAEGQNGPVLVGFQGGPTRWTGTATLTQEQATALLTGQTYVNVHSAANPGGEIRAQVK
jgi:plastocyanin